MNIKQIRLSKGFDIKYIKMMTGISESNLKKWESGTYDPKLSEAKKIASLFNINVLSLLGYGINKAGNSEIDKGLIKLRRTAMRIKSLELANMLGISTSILGRIERYEYDIRLSLIIKLIHILNLQINEVIL